MLEVTEILKKEEQTKVIFRCSKDMDETLTRIAEGEGKSKSMVIRDLIQKGLVAGGYIEGQQELGQLVQDAVTSVLRPQVERLASISAKASQISAADFFMHVYLAKEGLPQDEAEDIDAVAEKARRLGNEYVKLAKGKDVDQFISSANRRMANGSRPE